MAANKGTLKLILEEVTPGPMTTLEATFQNDGAVDIARHAAPSSTLSLESLEKRLRQMLAFVEHCKAVRTTL